MTTIPPVIDFKKWIDDNRHLLQPPVNNQTMALGDDFIVQVVGGPNQRTDYHLDPYEEWFLPARRRHPRQCHDRRRSSARRHSRG